MSTLLETYALQCGVKINKPWVNTSFYPLPESMDKVILIHAFAGSIQDGRATAPGKIYDHFNEVVEILTPILQKNGYKIYQIGAGGEPALKGVESLCGKTTFAQSSYLVKNCALLIGNDSVWQHLRGAEDKPMIVLFGGTSPKNTGSYFGSSDKKVFIESHRCGKKPTHLIAESPKTINFIPPETVAKQAAQILGIDEQIIRKSFCFGPEYLAEFFEIIPNTVIRPELNVGIPVIRMDYLFDEGVLVQNLNIRKCAIVTNKEINLNILSAFKERINSMRVEVDKVSQFWLKTVKKIGIPLMYISLERDPEKLKNLRLRLHDDCFFDKLEVSTKQQFIDHAKVFLNKEIDKDFDFSKLLFKTKKFILSDGRVFTSKAHWLAGKSVESTEKCVSQVIDSDEFWDDWRNGYFFEEK